MKKGSLSLSVNAIVTFVLAFAMLGFGLLIINNLRDETGGAVQNVFNLDDLQSPPTSQNPIVVDDAIRLKKSDTKNYKIGVYNNRDNSISDTFPQFSDCTSGLSGGTQIKVVGLNGNIAPSDSLVFQVNIVTEGVVNTGSFVCNLRIGSGNSEIVAQVPVEIVS